MPPSVAEGLPEFDREEWKKLFKPVPGRRGRLLLRPNAPAERVFFLEKGWARLYVPDEREEGLTVGVVGPGELFGEAALLGRKAYGQYAELLTPGEVYAAPAERLLRFAARRPAVAGLLARLLAERLGALETWIAEVLPRGMRRRVYRVLLELMREGELGYEVHLSHRAIGYLVGSARETVTRVLDDLARRGVVELGRHRIVIKDPEALEGELEE